MKPERIYEFAGHTLDLSSGRLQLGHEDVALRPKAFALLIYLLEHSGRVIDKEELIGAVWPTSIVTDDSLSQCLKDIRAALGVAAGQLIRTVPRRGYIVEAEQVRSRSRLPVRQSDRPTIAVFPFRPLTSDREHHWFAEGLSEDIATALTRSRQLTVVSRLTELAGSSSTADAAQALGVRYVVDGSVRLVGEHLRVSARLLDANSSTILWADRFDRYLSDVFAIQDEITAAIVRHLEIELLPEERQATQLSRTDNIEAYTYFRHGWQLARHWTKTHLLLARRMFAQAAELDPTFVRAHAAVILCDCFLLEWYASGQTPESILAMAERVLELDPNVPEAYVARGLAFDKTNRAEDAQAEYAKALTIDPSCYEARFFAGFCEWLQGRHDAAKAQFIEMTRLRPDDYLGPYFVLAVVEKPTPESLSWAQLTFELTERVAVLQPDNPAPLSRGSIALVHLGRFEQAVLWMRRALVLDPDDPITCFNAACVYSVTGDPDAALHWLGIYVQQSAEDMIKLVENEPELAGLRNHLTYKELLTRWGARPGSVANFPSRPCGA